MRVLSRAEALAFLVKQPRTAKLATVRPDGRPHVVPVWIDVEGGEVYFTSWHTTVKVNNMRQDDRIALCVDDEVPPYAFCLVEGRAELIYDLEQLRYWATRIAGRYMGADQAEAFGRRNAVPGELLVRVRIDRVVAYSGIAD